MEISRMRVSQVISHALRHHPDKFGLTLDEFGFAPLENLTLGINKKLGTNFSTRDIENIAIELGGERFLIKNGKIRAQYGHTIPISVAYDFVEPPINLFHGTLNENLKSIYSQGLLSHNHSVVFLTESYEEAVEAASRKGTPVILTIESLKAYQSGLSFRKLTSTVYGSDEIPTRFIKW